MVNDIDDAAPDWIIAPASAEAILRTMAEKYPFVPFGPGWRNEQGQQDGEGEAGTGDTIPGGKPLPDVLAPDPESSLSIFDAPVRLFEGYSYDQDSVDVATAPFAYVADYAVEVTGGVNVEEEMRKYAEVPKKGEEGWFEKLMVGLRVFGEDTFGVGWYVVVCEDEERDPGWDVEEEEEEGKEEGHEAEASDRTESRGEQIMKEKKQGEETPKGHEGGGEGDEGKSLKSRLKKMVPLRRKEKE